jgi:hypothetical protein
MLKVHDRVKVVYAADEMIAEGALGLSGEVISLNPEAASTGDPELDTMYTVRMDDAVNDAVLEDGFWIEELELCKEGE